MSVDTCLNGLVGLSASDVDCFTDERPEGFDQSETGYYINDPEYGLLIQACAMRGWDLLTRSKGSAVRDFKTDMASMLDEVKRRRYPNFSGWVGKAESSTTLDVPGRWVGQRILAGQKKGLSLNVKGLKVGIVGSGSRSIWVVSNRPGFTPVEYTFSPVSGQFSSAEVGSVLKLPLWDDSVSFVKYWIVYDCQGADPLANKIACCGERPAWQETLDISGWYLTDKAAPETGGGSGVYGGAGLCVECFLSCDTLGWVCYLDELGGFDLKSVLGRTLQFRAAALAISELVQGPALNTCVLYDREQLEIRRTFLNKRYGENLQWLAQKLTDTLTFCHHCDNESDIIHEEILS